MGPHKKRDQRPADSSTNRGLFSTKCQDQNYYTDASPFGVGAVLEQEQKDGSYQPIYYASRKLSEVERRYSRFERETLAARWTCEKFYLYLCGVKYELRTDHKPLYIVDILGKESDPPSARVEGLLLYLQQFQYEIVYTYR